MQTKQEKEALRFSKSARLGTWIAFLSVFSIGSIEIFKRVPYLQVRLLWAGLIILGFGLILLLMDLEGYQKKSTPEEVLRFYRNPHYWGSLLVVSAAIIYTFCPSAESAPPVIVYARSAPVPEEPIIFPDLRVTAVVVNGSRSSATLNGKVVLLGEDILGAKLIEVTETNILIEFKGHEKRIHCFSVVGD